MFVWPRGFHLVGGTRSHMATWWLVSVLISMAQTPYTSAGTVNENHGLLRTDLRRDIHVASEHERGGNFVLAWVENSLKRGSANRRIASTSDASRHITSGSFDLAGHFHATMRSAKQDNRSASGAILGGNGTLDAHAPSEPLSPHPAQNSSLQAAPQPIANPSPEVQRQVEAPQKLPAKRAFPKPEKRKLDASCKVPEVSDALIGWDVETLGKHGGAAKHRRVWAVEKTLDKIRDIEGPVTVVSVIGPYRTGKSMLLNHLSWPFLPPSTQAFKVGHTVQPETEEVSLLLIPRCALPAHFNRTLLLLDSPGLFAPNRPALFDAQVLAVLNLLSSVVLYNSLGVIDRSAVERLSQAVDTAFTMSYFEAKESDSKLSRPTLLWVIQNFHLELEAAGKTMGGGEWLESVLKTMDRSNNGSASIHHQFAHFFNGISAQPLPYPVEMVEDIPRLHDISLADLAPKYLDKLETLRNEVLSHATSKTMGPLPLSGSLLASLISKWTTTMSAGHKSNSAEGLLAHILEKEVVDASDKYQSQMKMWVLPPMPRSDIMDKHHFVAYDLTRQVPSPQFVALLHARVQPILDSFLQQNEKRITEAVAAIAYNANFSAHSEFDRISNPIRADLAYPTVVSVLEQFQNEASQQNLGWADPEAVSKAKGVLTETLSALQSRLYLRFNKEKVKTAKLSVKICAVPMAQFIQAVNTSLAQQPVAIVKLPFGDSREAVRGCVEEAKAFHESTLRNLTGADDKTMESLREIARRELNSTATLHLRRREGLSDFAACAASHAYPVPTEILQACLFEGLRKCRGSNGAVLCALTQEIEELFSLYAASNNKAFRNTCERKAIKRLEETKAVSEKWWVGEEQSRWHPQKRLEGALNLTIQADECYSALLSHAVVGHTAHRLEKLRIATIEELQKRSRKRQEASDSAQAGVLCVLALSLFWTLVDNSPCSNTFPSPTLWTRMRALVVICIVSLALSAASAVVMVCAHTTWRPAMSPLSQTFHWHQDGVSLEFLCVVAVLILQWFAAVQALCRRRGARSNLKSVYQSDLNKTV